MNEQDKMTKYTNRYLARIVLEAETPLKVGTGESNILTDALVALEANGLPYIPGTAIAGLLRHSFEDDKGKDIFGFHELPEDRDIRLRQNEGKDQPKDLSKGSEIIFTEARMIGKEGKVLDGICKVDWNDEFYRHFRQLPIRQHVRIDERGTAVKGAKFDEQIVFKGTRFCFEIEMLGTGDQNDDFENILKQLQIAALRFGGGTRRGFGKLTVIYEKSYYANLNLKNTNEREAYLDKSSDLSQDDFWQCSRYAHCLPTCQEEKNDWIKYELELTPEDFFLFGAGVGDNDADLIPVSETFIFWDENSGEPEFSERQKIILIPASSVKGALAHRVAFYWNQLDERYADSEDPSKKALIGKDNSAVCSLFGAEGTYIEGKLQNQKRGNVIFSDVMDTYKELQVEKILNHVAIDRYTGGARKGALFSEKVVYGNKQSLPAFSIWVHRSVISEQKVLKSWEKALMDLAGGMLALGGHVNHGYGVFTGKIKKDQELIFDYEEGGLL